MLWIAGTHIFERIGARRASKMDVIQHLWLSAISLDSAVDLSRTRHKNGRSTTFPAETENK